MPGSLLISAAILLTVSVIAALISKMLGTVGRFMLGIASLITFLYLLGIWMTLFDVTVLAEILTKIPGQMYIVSLGAGISLGGLVGELLPLP